MERSEGGGLVVHVDQDRSRGHDVDGRIGDRGKVLGRRPDKRHPARDTLFGRQRPGVREEVIRHVGHDDAAINTNPVKRPERDQPVARTDVEHDLPSLDPCVVQDSLAHWLKKLLPLLALLRIIAVTSMEQPRRPLVNHVFLAHRPEDTPGSPTVGCHRCHVSQDRFTRPDAMA
jgi:hypothetical protein